MQCNQTQSTDLEKDINAQIADRFVNRIARGFLFGYGFDEKRGRRDVVVSRFQAAVNVHKKWNGSTEGSYSSASRDYLNIGILIFFLPLYYPSSLLIRVVSMRRRRKGIRDEWRNPSATVD
uniref:Uncharacterized protein n=1 Tax=Pseudo-nitzschia australis TaxID=44445 RepID=A0A7S4AAT9_9STRA